MSGISSLHLEGDGVGGGVLVVASELDDSDLLATVGEGWEMKEG